MNIVQKNMQALISLRFKDNARHKLCEGFEVFVYLSFFSMSCECEFHLPGLCLGVIML